MAVQAALEWAFRVEKVWIDLPDPRPAEERGTGFGMEYVLIQRAILGCKVDGGGQSDPHEDAEVIAAAVGGLPESLGGKRMALIVANAARAGTPPDWMPGAQPRAVPSEWRENQHGRRAAEEVVEVLRVRARGRLRKVEVRAYPIRWVPHPDQIRDARRAYYHWWHALVWLRDALREGGMLREIEIVDVLPPARPWERK